MYRRFLPWVLSALAAGLIAYANLKAAESAHFTGTADGGALVFDVTLAGTGPEIPSIGFPYGWSGTVTNGGTSDLGAVRFSFDNGSGHSGFLSSTQTANLVPGANYTVYLWKYGGGVIAGPVTVVGSYTPAAVFKVKLDWQNPYSYAVQIRVVHPVDGVLGTVTLQPGETFHATYTVSTGDAVSVQMAVDGMGRDGPVWTTDPGAMPEFFDVGGSYSPSSVPPSSEPDPLTIENVDLPSELPASTTITNNNFSRTTVWRTPKNSGTTTQNSLGETTYQEGVGKIESGIGALAEKVSATNTAIAGLGGKLDSGNGILQQISDGVAAANTHLVEIRDGQQETDLGSLVTATQAANPSSETMASGGEIAASAASAVFGDPLEVPSYEITPDAPDLTVTLPASFGGAVFDLNPFSSDRFGSVASWFRTAMIWAVLVVFGRWVWEQIGAWVRGFSVLPQAKGNTVAAGTGGQATALVAAGLISAALIVGTTALVGWSFGEISFGFLRTTLGGNPVASMASASLWLLDQILPVATCITVALARVAFGIYAPTVYVSTAAVVRFIVP